MRLILLGALFLTGCQTVHYPKEPVIVYTPLEGQIEILPSAFEPLTDKEKNEAWAHELLMGDVFAKELDLYRAVTCYKRARILIPSEFNERILQIDYDIIFCYYLGHRYQDAVNTFEVSPLTKASPSFPAFINLVTILYDSYKEVGQWGKADDIFHLIEKGSPETAQDLALFTDLSEGNLPCAHAKIEEHSKKEAIEEALSDYYCQLKSPIRARRLNAILPGAGYYYVGQKNSAITSFLINTLFTAAAYQFFQRGYIAAGLITTSMEMGWYLGGINGAGIEAEEYNKHLYEGIVKSTLMETKLFPILMFETAF